MVSIFYFIEIHRTCNGEDYRHNKNINLKYTKGIALKMSIEA